MLTSRFLDHPDVIHEGDPLILGEFSSRVLLERQQVPSGHAPHKPPGLHLAVAELSPHNFLFTDDWEELDFDIFCCNSRPGGDDREQLRLLLFRNRWGFEWDSSTFEGAWVEQFLILLDWFLSNFFGWFGLACRFRLCGYILRLGWFCGGFSICTFWLCRWFLLGVLCGCIRFFSITSCLLCWFLRLGIS